MGTASDPSAGVIRTRRLTLPPMSCKLMRAVIDEDWAAAERLLGTGFPDEWRQDGWAWLRPRMSEGERDAASLAWGTRLTRPSDRNGGGHEPVIAEVGFHGPPDSGGWVEIGYRVVEKYRRRGFGEEAVTGLLAWAGQRSVTGIKASVSPVNTASIALLGKLGFAESGSYRHTQLGEQLSFRLPG